MWTKGFWLAVLERMVRAAAAAVLSTFFVLDKTANAFDMDWSEAGGVALGGALVSLVLSLVGNVTSGNGPAITPMEKVDPTEP